MNSLRNEYNKILVNRDKILKENIRKDIRNISEELADSVMSRINRVINIDTLSEDDKQQDINPRYMTVKVLDLTTRYVHFDDFKTRNLLMGIKDQINVKLKPKGFCVYSIQAPSMSNGGHNIVIEFGIIHGWKTIFKDLYYHITGQWDKKSY